MQIRPALSRLVAAAAAGAVLAFVGGAPVHADVDPADAAVIFGETIDPSEHDGLRVLGKSLRSNVYECARPTVRTVLDHTLTLERLREKALEVALVWALCGLDVGQQVLDGELDFQAETQSVFFRSTRRELLKEMVRVRHVTDHLDEAIRSNGKQRAAAVMRTQRDALNKLMKSGKTNIIGLAAYAGAAYTAQREIPALEAEARACLEEFDARTDVPESPDKRKGRKKLLRAIEILEKSKKRSGDLGALYQPADLKGLDANGQRLTRRAAAKLYERQVKTWKKVLQAWKSAAGKVEKGKQALQRAIDNAPPTDTSIPAGFFPTVDAGDYYAVAYVSSNATGTDFIPYTWQFSRVGATGRETIDSRASLWERVNAIQVAAAADFERRFENLYEGVSRENEGRLVGFEPGTNSAGEPITVAVYSPWAEVLAADAGTIAGAASKSWSFHERTNGYEGYYSFRDFLDADGETLVRIGVAFVRAQTPPLISSFVDAFTPGEYRVHRALRFLPFTDGGEILVPLDDTIRADEAVDLWAALMAELDAHADEYSETFAAFIDPRDDARLATFQAVIDEAACGPPLFPVRDPLSSEYFLGRRYICPTDHPGPLQATRADVVLWVERIGD